MSKGRSLSEAWELVEYAWREFDHPRAADGKFGSGGGSAKGASKPAAKKPARRTPRKAAAKPAATKPAPKAAVAKKAPATSSTAPSSPPPVKDKSWLGEHYSDWRGSLTPAQKKAMSGYQGADYALMNAELRSKGKSGVKDDRFNDEEMARAARANRAMNDAIRKAPPTTEPMTVFRTMTAAQAADLAPGSVMGDKGFVSTSLEPRKTSRGATVEVALPAGTRAAIGDGGEMILPASGKFRVVSVEEGPTGQPHVRMEFVPHGSSSKPKAAPAAGDETAPEAPAKAAPKQTPKAPDEPDAPEAAPKVAPKSAPKPRAKSAKPAKADAETPASTPSLTVEEVQELYGPRLRIQEGSERGAKHAKDFAKIPLAFHDRLVPYLRGGVDFGDGSVADFKPELRGVQPRGWPPGDTWDGVSGVFDGVNRHVVAAGGRNIVGEAVSLALHETGHAVDYALYNASTTPEFRALHADAVKRGVMPYFSQPGNAGPEETFAETFAAWVLHREDPPAKRNMAIGRAVGVPRARAGAIGRQLGDFYDKLLASIED